MCAHNTRAVSGENIREDAPPPKELLELGSDDFVSSAKALLNELEIPKNSLEDKVIAVETVTTASRDWFDKASDEDKQEWVDANVAWATKKFGRGLLSAKLHLDEEVWHIHFVALPVVEKLDLPRGAKPKDPAKLAEYERRKASAVMRWTLSYHDILGGKNQRLSEEQGIYHAAVAHLGLERGEVQRDDLEIEIGDELTVSALALSRGRKADGTARPRRSMTPAEGRTAVKRLLREAEADRKLAEEARGQAETERVVAAVARAEAGRNAQEVADQLRHVMRQQEEASASAFKARQEREALAAERALAEQQRQKAEVDRAALTAALAQAEQDRSALACARATADEAAAAADAERRVAEKEREAIVAERQAIAKEREALALRQKRQREEIELLARGADDENGLNLHPTQEGFEMTVAAMTTEERAVSRQMDRRCDLDWAAVGACPTTYSPPDC